MNKRTNNRKVKRIIIVAVFAIALSVISAFVLVPLVNNKGVRADKKPHETRNVHIPLVNNKDVGADKKLDETTTEYLSDDGWMEYIYAKKVQGYRNFYAAECDKA